MQPLSTYVGGHISQNTVWSLAGSPYIVVSSVTVDPGATLTIEAGVEVYFNTSTALYVDGGLIAEGTAAQPIVLSAPATNIYVVRFNQGSYVRLDYCDISRAGAGSDYSVRIVTSDVRMDHCKIHDNIGSLQTLLLEGIGLTIRNTVLADNNGAALRLVSGARLDAFHTTLARNGTGVYVDGSGTAVLTNTIIYSHTIGVRVTGSGQATLVHTLWDRNTTPTVGPVNEIGHLDGVAAFAADGYHLTRYSAALEQGVDTGLADDLDGDPRPLPAGTLPDLGADEYPFSPGTEFVAEKAPFAPQWVVDPANPYGRLQQRYLLRFYYGSSEPNPPDLPVIVTDTLPAELAFQSEWHVPEMAFQQQGQQLTWQTVSPVPYGQSGEILIASIYDNPEPGRLLTNTAELSAGEFHFDLQATTHVPVIAPLIVSGGSGELCPGTIVVSGTAQAGVAVTLYANDAPVAQAPVDADGIFTVTYDYPGGNVTLKARACAPSGVCSVDSNRIALEPSQSFWCPQRSSWEGTPEAGPLAGQHLVYRFRNAWGRFSTQEWLIPGVYGFWDTLLHLYVCSCPPASGSTDPPTSVWVVADGVRCDDPSPSPPWYDFAITSFAHDVHFYAQCGSNVVDSHGTVLIDPDGYVFDVTQGFTPTLHPVAGVTVTCMISMTEWGGWVPWPAHLYNNQVNPQVTGEDGYFAFFTPPGHYYLQVEGKPGYQPWRSPVIEVTTQIVHVNVPYTPWPTGDVSQVTLTLDGPDPAVITVPVGSSVEWVAELDSGVPPEEWVRLTENPVLRPLSELDPLYDTRAWDGGMMSPGRVYRREFTQVGTYSYTDGLGNTGQVVVLDLPITGLSATNDGPTVLGQPTTLTATVGSGSNVVYTWAFGDGTVGSGAVVTHTYPAVGVYTATVTATNRVSSATATTRVTIVQSRFFIYLPLVLRSR